jgi:pimeloyl-ACP methyl ester carboxylesterase
MITLIALGMLLVPFLVFGGGTALIWKRKRRSIQRFCLVAYLLVAVVVLFGIGPYLAAWTIAHAGTRLPDRELKDTPEEYRLPYEEVAFSARDSLRLRGWFIPPTGRQTIVICTHGLFRNRIEMLARMVPVVRAGYGALLYDARSHGASDRGITSLGFYERNDVLGAIQYVRQRYQDAPQQPGIVLMGVSMGAVASLEAAAETADYSALVLDSPYASIKDAVVSHSALLLKLPRYSFPPLFMLWFQRIAGLDADPINTPAALQKVQPVPLLLIASEGDSRIGPQLTRNLYRHSRSPAKRIEVFGPEVPHGAAARIYPQKYSALLVDFLESVPVRAPE